MYVCVKWHCQLFHDIRPPGPAVAKLQLCLCLDALRQVVCLQKMSYLYKVVNNENNNRENFVEKCAICQISKKNIVCFCLFQEDKQSQHTSHVYVSDVLIPWYKHKVCSAKSIVSVLEWNSTGELLLIGYKDGIIEIWSPSNQLLNNWRLLYTSKYAGEEIVAAKFFHNGKSVLFSAMKKDFISYAEKFERLEHKPTVTGFGDAHNEGCIIVTASGLLGALILPKPYASAESEETLEVRETTQSVGLTRSYIAHCSIVHCASGGLYLAFCGWKENIIHCLKVVIQTANDDVHLSCESMPSIFLTLAKHEDIARIKWYSLRNENAIFIAYNAANNKNSRLEQWTLIHKNNGLHKFLQKSKDFINYECWEKCVSLHFPSIIREICLTKLAAESMELQLVLKDNILHVVESRRGVVDRLADNGRLTCTFMAADVSHMNQLLVGFDSFGQMCAIQVQHQPADKNYKLNTLSLQVALLEYCIVTGIDASDILMSNAANIDIITEKLTENYTRQPTCMRHFFYSNFLSLKNKLCRIQSRQHDFDNLIILHCISITFKSLLRPSDLSCQDKSPADNLALTLSEPLLDIDKVLLNLDAKDFTVEPVTLQSLQHLIQWVSDLALSILHKLPDEVLKSKHSKKVGYDISRDVVAIGSIRELLVMVRIWGLLNAQCLPIYLKSAENFDVLAVLFRLLTRLTQTNTEPEELLLDECSVLSNQVLIPQRHYSNVTTFFNCFLPGMKPPFLFNSGIEPIGLQDIQVEAVTFANSVADGVHNFQLGCRLGNIRKCTRCGFVNTLHKVTKTSALRAWCQRWVYCHCGGFWTTI